MTIVIMRYWQDMSVAEVAAGLGLPIGTVKSNCSKAMASIRKQLLRSGYETLD